MRSYLFRKPRPLSRTYDLKAKMPQARFMFYFSDIMNYCERNHLALQQLKQAYKTYFKSAYDTWRHLYSDFKAARQVANPSLFKLLTIPISFLVIEMFMAPGKCDELAEKPYLGCSIREKDVGMQILMIKSDSPAARSGLRIKDIIVEIDGKKVSTIYEYNAAVGRTAGVKRVKVKRLDDDNNSAEYLEFSIEFTTV